ncbi:Uncharacterized protein HZ326_8148 [Fusarium oxysporum f. sp. albedinis]|nr:Uncharacterized protein HZ326_8148 [Fusarium oxysporum f. sp. albedinis]
MVVDGCKRRIRYAGGPTKREMAGNKSDITFGLTDPELYQIIMHEFLTYPLCSMQSFIETCENLEPTAKPKMNPSLVH